MEIQDSPIPTKIFNLYVLSNDKDFFSVGYSSFCFLLDFVINPSSTR